jgi:hypothetical protein
LKKNFSKIFIAFVAIIYVLSTVGVSVFSHYCGGELEKVTLFSKAKSCCGDEEDTAMEDDGCCKDEIVHVSFQKDFTFYTLVKSIKAPVNELFIIQPDFKLVFFKTHIADFLSIDEKVHPPNLVQHDLVSCSVIRI